MPGLWHFVPLTRQIISDGMPGLPDPPRLLEVCPFHNQDEEYEEIRRLVWLLWARNLETPLTRENCVRFIDYLKNLLYEDFGGYIQETEAVCIDCGPDMIAKMWYNFVRRLK